MHQGRFCVAFDALAAVLRWLSDRRPNSRPPLTASERKTMLVIQTTFVLFLEEKSLCENELCVFLLNCFQGETRRETRAFVRCWIFALGNRGASDSLEIHPTLPQCEFQKLQSWVETTEITVSSCVSKTTRFLNFQCTTSAGSVNNYSILIVLLFFKLYSW